MMGILMAATLVARGRRALLHSCGLRPRPHRRPAAGDVRRVAGDRRAVRRRRHADDAVERRAERAEALEADLEADLADAELGVAQELLRALDAPRQHVLVRALAEGLLEAAAE